MQCVCVCLCVGVKAFKCNVCNSSFTTNGSLNRHMVIHLNTKPFRCSVCAECFRTVPLRRKHMKLYHAIGTRGSSLIYYMNNKWCGQS